MMMYNIVLFYPTQHYSNLETLRQMQARRQGGFDGVRSNPSFGLQRFYIHGLLNLSALPFESGLLVSLLLKITAVSKQVGCSYGGLFMENQRGTRT